MLPFEMPIKLWLRFAALNVPKTSGPDAAVLPAMIVLATPAVADPVSRMPPPVLLASFIETVTFNRLSEPLETLMPAPLVAKLVEIVEFVRLNEPALLEIAPP